MRVLDGDDDGDDDGDHRRLWVMVAMTRYGRLRPPMVNDMRYHLL